MTCTAATLMTNSKVFSHVLFFKQCPASHEMTCLTVTLVTNSEVFNLVF